MSHTAFSIIVTNFDLDRQTGKTVHETLIEIDTGKPDLSTPSARHFALNGEVFSRNLTAAQEQQDVLEFRSYCYPRSPITITVTDVDHEEKSKREAALFDLSKITLRQSWPYQAIGRSRRSTTVHAKSNAIPKTCRHDSLHVPKINSKGKIDTSSSSAIKVGSSCCNKCKTAPVVAVVAQKTFPLAADYRRSDVYASTVAPLLRRAVNVGRFGRPLPSIPAGLVVDVQGSSTTFSTSSSRSTLSLPSPPSTALDPAADFSRYLANTTDDIIAALGCSDVHNTTDEDRDDDGDDSDDDDSDDDDFHVSTSIPSKRDISQLLLDEEEECIDPMMMRRS